MCEQTETETEPEVTPRVAFATVLQSLVAESPNKPTLPVMLSMLDQAMDHTGLRLELAAAPADYEDDVAEARRGLSRKAYDVASLLADVAAGDGDWELFDLADEARSAAVALLRALDGDA
ncbi:DNA ligase [Bifidobacterium longum]|uniref:DNA ligase n=1 Tax=Bifidobacterium longum TaxID=216816 RepID=UPI0032DE389C